MLLTYIVTLYRNEATKGCGNRFILLVSIMSHKLGMILKLSYLWTLFNIQIVTQYANK